MVARIRSELEPGGSAKTEIIWRPNQRQKALIACPVPDRLFGGARGGGKGQPYSALVATPFGFKRMGDLKVGDIILNPTGAPQSVIAVYELGARDIYQVRFDDGATCQVTDDHLWQAWVSSSHKTKVTRTGFVDPYEGLPEGRGKIWTTRQIIDWLEAKETTGVNADRHIKIPLCLPLSFTRSYRVNMRPIHPYALGVLLGDGNLADESVGLHSHDDDSEVICRLKDECGLSLSKHKQVGDWGVLGLMEPLRRLGLAGCRSFQKFIPEPYKYAPVQDRFQLVQGLMDTDGYVDDRGHLSFTSTSRQLAEDFQWLVRSLGATATLTSKNPICTNGKPDEFGNTRVEGSPAYTVYFRAEQEREMVSLGRKRARVSSGFNGGISKPGRRFESIEYIGQEEARCIQVDALNQLYVTNDFVVTHNSLGCIGHWIYKSDKYGKDARGLFLRRTYDELAEIERYCEKYLKKLGAQWRASKRTWIMPNGATLMLRYLDKDVDAEHFMGFSLTDVYIDEAGNFPSSVPIDLLRGSLRSAAGVPCQMTLTANPGGSGHCVPYGEVLTPKGWIKIQEIRVGDPVYTVAANGEMTVSHVEQTHSSYYQGKLAVANARGFHLACTPNHKIARVNPSDDPTQPFFLTEAERLPGQATVLRTVKWAGNPIPCLELAPRAVTTYQQRSRLNQPLRLKGADYAELMGWFLSEGYTNVRDGEFAISQSKPDGRVKICRMLDRLGFAYRTDPSTIIVASWEWCNYLAQFGKCRQKFVPESIKSATPEELRVFFDAAVDGDGHWGSAKRDSGQYYTISRQLADDFAEIALKLGYIVHVSQRLRENRVGLHYCVYFKRTKSGGTELLTGNHVYSVDSSTKRPKSMQLVDYEGAVYCIGVPDTHTFILRQNGSVWVSGNSWLQSRYVKPAPPMTPFYDEMAKTWRVFIPSLLDDNPDLLVNDPGYKDRLASSAIGKPWLLLAWLRGDWNASPQGGLLQLDWFKRFGSQPHGILRLIQSWDTAQTKQVGSCPWAGLTIAETLDGYYLLDSYSQKHIYPEGKRVVRSQALKWCPQTILIENKSSGIDLINELRESFWGEMEHPGFTPNIMPIKPEGDKVQRLSVESDTIESGRVWLPEYAAWLPEFEAKVTAYPNSGKDEIDALSQALKYFRTHPIVREGEGFSVGQPRASYKLTRGYR